MAKEESVDDEIAAYHTNEYRQVSGCFVVHIVLLYYVPLSFQILMMQNDVFFEIRLLIIIILFKNWFHRCINLNSSYKV